MMQLCSAQNDSRDATRLKLIFFYIATETNFSNFSLMQGLRHCARIDVYVIFNTELWHPEDLDLFTGYIIFL